MSNFVKTSNDSEQLLTELREAVAAEVEGQPDSRKMQARVVARFDEESKKRETTDLLLKQIDKVRDDYNDTQAQRVFERIRERLASSEDPLAGRTQTTWTDEPVQREWLVRGWLPRGRVALLTGEGAAGKSTLALQLAAAVASERGLVGAGLPVLPAADNMDEYRDRLRIWRRSKGTPETVLMLTWEDEPEEILRRLSWLPRAADKTEFRHALGERLMVVDLAGRGPLWGPEPGHHAAIVASETPVGRAVTDLMEQVRPSLVVIDPLAGAYGGNENERAAVRQFMAHWGEVAARTGAAVLMVAHPPKDRKMVYSGSTDWRNAARVLWQLTTALAPGLSCRIDGKEVKAEGTVLIREKSSYSRSGERLWLRFVVEGFRDDGQPGSKAEPRLHWEACSSKASAMAWHRHKRLPEPSRREDGGSGRPNQGVTGRVEGV